ncbi:Protein N-acetyltransferase, RimJ/RimL family [Aquimarina amphilecti]|uniref:Protein N-acetyltransferase, RimJ/RimL family n=1 Tax=Aquimarina amphilecti TaxID=1038014 RepID=A0A1H7S5T2_AQUAM|nr:GNAT family protein [Aquimarina amphilecti]SEL68011.1 Protein N-acetyltransferase, RimJ/RimL family [Aquimarina amphilecti]
MKALDFSKEYILENDNVRLMPLNLEHIEKLLKVSNDPNIWTFFLEKGENRKELLAYFLNAIDNRKIEKEYPFIVYDKTRKAYAGTTRFYDYSKELRVIKLGHTWYGKDFRGTQVNKNCKYLLLEFAFEYLGLERIGFGAHIKNKISIAAMKSIGCKEEGVLRNFIPSLDGKGRANIILFSILRNEWQAFGQFQLSKKLKNKSIEL